MRNYIAILHKDQDSDFGVSFPDFPGCITAGSTLDDALRHEFAEGAQAFFLVEVPFDDPIVRANITVPKGMLDRIDRYAKAHHLSRSAFLTQAAQRAMH